MRSFFCGDEAQVQSPVCFNNLLNGPSEPGHEGRIENVFSNSTHGGKEEQTMAWTLSSLGHSRRLHGRSNEIAALRQAYRSLWEPKSDSKPTGSLKSDVKSITIAFETSHFQSCFKVLEGFQIV